MKAERVVTVKNPHPLMQQGTPPVDVETEHVLKFTVFRLGGGGPPVHVETIDAPLQFTDPESIHRLVGGGTYTIKALANPHSTGRQNCSVLATTNYSWDGAPIVKPAPHVAIQSAAVAQPVIEQVTSNLPTLISAATAVLGFLTESRNAREAAEQRRREYDDNRRREEQAERDRRDAKERAEAEERRAREAREAEERRAEREAREAERRDQMRIEAETRAEQSRRDAEAREHQNTFLLQALLGRKDPNDALVQTLLGRALERPPPPPSASDEANKIIEAASKLKDISSGDSSKDMMELVVGLANSPLVQTPAIQQALGRALSIVGLHNKPEMPQAPEPILVPESAVTVAQMPQEVPQAAPEPPMVQVAAPDVSVGGPVHLN